MKEFNPNPDLWSRIQTRKEFDNQLQGLITELPERSPKAELWSNIENILDQQEAPIPIWKYLSIAAAIILIVSFSGIYFMNQNSTTINPQDQVAINSDDLDLAPSVEKEIILEKKNSPEELQKDAPIPLEDNIEKKRQDVSVPKKVDKPAITEIKNNGLEASSLIIPERSLPQKAPSYHQVTIAWEIQEKIKIRTQFGKRPEIGIHQQIGKAEPSKRTIQIDFKRK
ncbi:hypothetical protein [Algoriphagus halophilus]|uniref:Uncharacterized protein n=1 Tax=Algoriphagus halophilus TaxID=226505 RepID=A0A1N6GZ92_9BACT|nr:hypothetical protein [Algoriphagus halophilus]SIO12762.1 hypothetical protein SAMN05444394_3403 [Algoriphagus halophilus]